MKVLYYSYIPMPYRIDFFNELGKSCDLTVIFGVKNKGFNETWMTIQNTNFSCMFLHNGMNESSLRILQLLRMLSKKEYEIFVVDGYADFAGMFIVEYLRIKRIPFILNSDGSFIKKGYRISNIIKRHLIKSASYWNCSGEYTKKTLVHYGAVVDKVSIYPLTSLFEHDISCHAISAKEKEELRNELGIAREKIAISVGQYIYRKGFDILIKAWIACDFSDDYELIIIGEGVLKDVYMKTINDLHINNIKVIDFQQKKELFKYYKASDVFVLPTRQDVWGLVVNEAMACSLPIISTDMCIAALELVNDFENGFIIPAENAEMLAEKLRIILSDTTMQNNMSRESIRIIRDYTIENMVKHHIDLFCLLNIK